MGLVIFILLVLSTLLGSHYLIYFTMVRFLCVESASLRIVLFVALVTLSMSFFVSAILVRLHRNPVTEGISFLSAFWIGLMTHLLLVVALAWLVKLVAWLAGWSPDMRLVVGPLFGAALLFSLYGTINAQFPRVRRLAVEIAGLPERWKGRTIVHLSDAHLGAVCKKGYFERVVRKVNALEPELILITGDLFDGMEGGLMEFAGLLDSLRAQKGVFFVTGNHEGYLGLVEPLAVLARTRIRILDHEVVDVDGLQVVGIGFPEHDAPARDLEALGRLIDPAKPSILMYHTPTDVVGSAGDRGRQQTRTYFSPPTRFAFQREHGIDLQLSGHTHQGQYIPFTYLARWIFRGYDYGLHRVGDFAIYTTSGVGTWGPPMRTGSVSEIAVIVLR